MKMVFIAMAMAALLAAGCATSPKYGFPDDLSGQCYAAQAESKGKLESVGTKLKDPRSCIVTKHLGEKKFGTMWCWMDPGWKQYVGGLCWGMKIEVGCNPKTLGEVMYPVLTHEFAHYWLLDIGSGGHDARYAKLFLNWVEPKVAMVFVAAEGTDIAKATVARRMEGLKSGDWMSVDGVDKDGVKYHIDFVKE